MLLAWKNWVSHTKDMNVECTIAFMKVFFVMITTKFQHSTFGIAILWAKISCLMPFIIPYILGRMEKPESGIRNRSRKRKRKWSWNPNWNRNLNWDQGKLGSTETSSDTRVGIKFKMASSVIIVLRNFQHSDRDTKGILTFGKWLAKKKVSASYCYS